jgi:alkanesulfonate monooxygenase SsuD/methylene tetrahydromethanopterin reductase-like flavin-dependent oxidoreductase (luciferase family)
LAGSGEPLAFEGEFYTHTLMPPKSIPRDTQHGRPRITVAAVGRLMTKVAAEVADGVICQAAQAEVIATEGRSKPPGLAD